MHLFRNRKHIEAMMEKSLTGYADISNRIDSYGYAFSLVMGNDSMGYACFFEQGQGKEIACIAENADYDSKLFGEMYDNADRGKKRIEFISSCEKNGIRPDIAVYFIDMFERVALGESLNIPGVSDSAIYMQLVTKIMRARKVILTMDESAIFWALSILHKELEEIETFYPFGYDGRRYAAMYRTWGKREKRFKSYCDFLSYAAECSLAIHRKVENEILMETVKEDTIAI